MQTQLDRNTFGLFGFYERQRELGTPIGAATIAPQAEDTSRGVSVNWARSLTPRLNSSANLGYATQSSRRSEDIDSQFAT